MNHHHAPTVGSGFDPIVLLTLLVLTAGVSYAALAWRQSSLRRRWPLERTISFILGTALVTYSLNPALMEAGHADLRVHMTQHMLLGMFAPLLLALGEPLTLLLRSLPAWGARRVLALLHAVPLRWLMSPVAALALNVGGMYLLYLTPLYAAMRTQGWLHLLVHFHFLAAGFLYTVVIAGRYPSTLRSPFAWRLGTLLIGTALHATLGKLMFAGLYPHGTGAPAAVIEAAARSMYYWGDAAEALLAGVLFWDWLKARDRQRARQPSGIRNSATARSLPEQQPQS